jgi:uncharacterized protein (TIGR03067 family)
MLHSLLALTALLVTFQSEKSPDLQKLQGTWRTIRLETGDSDPLVGDQASQDSAQTLHWRFKGNQLLRYFRTDKAGDEIAMTVVLEPDCNPKRITLTRVFEDGTVSCHGIYQLRNDTLVICVGCKSREQPQEFSAKLGVRELWVMKRYDPPPYLRVLHSIGWHIQDIWDDMWDMAESSFATLCQWTDGFAR